MIVGEAPGESELAVNRPFSGYAGKELGNMLQEAGIMLGECFLTNVVRILPPGGDPTAFIAEKKKEITNNHVMVYDKFVLPPVVEGIELLRREIELCQPNVIIALGNLALFALTGRWGITSWRGSVLPLELSTALDYSPKVVPTFSPALILRQWSQRPICVMDLRRAKANSLDRTLPRMDYNFIIRPDFETAISTLYMLFQKVQAGPTELSVDIETRAGHIACVGIAWNEREALCIPLMTVLREEGYWHPEDEAVLVYAMYQLLTHPNAIVEGQNFLYDAQYIHRHFHFIPNVKWDTMLAQHTLFPNMPKSLDFISSMYLPYHAFWKHDGKEWEGDGDEDRYWRYNCEDACKTFDIARHQRKAIAAMGMEEVNNFQQELFHPVLHTMLRGIRSDETLRSRFAFTLQEEIAKREQWLMDVLGFPLNIKSSPQMKELFYEVFKQKPIIDRKTGNPSCNDEALRRIGEREPLLLPLVRRISELRSLGVFFSTFINAPLDTDGRIRCSFNIGGTETFRFSSSKNAFGTGLNLQNIPKGGDEGEGLELPNVRSLFIPDPGMTFFDIDLSSADLRIVVWEADEPEMKAMLREGLDPYTEIAKEFYNDPTITKKDPRRQTFKSFAHGTNYMGTAKGLAERLGLSIADSEKTQRWYFSRFPRIKKWQDDLKDQVTKRRFVQNVFGYRCYFFDRIEGTIFNQAAAWIPQSTVACLINRAYLEIYKTLPEVEILLQVHDSLAGQFPSHLGDWAVQQIVSKAEIALPYPGDPLIIPVGVKTSAISWGDCG